MVNVNRILCFPLKMMVRVVQCTYLSRLISSIFRSWNKVGHHVSVYESTPQLQYQSQAVCVRTVRTVCHLELQQSNYLATVHLSKYLNMIKKKYSKKKKQNQAPLTILYLPKSSAQWWNNVQVSLPQLLCFLFRDRNIFESQSILYYFFASVLLNLSKKRILTGIMRYIWCCVEELMDSVATIATDNRKAVGLCMFLNDSSNVTIFHTRFY